MASACLDLAGAGVQAGLLGGVAGGLPSRKPASGGISATFRTSALHPSLNSQSPVCLGKAEQRSLSLRRACFSCRDAFYNTQRLNSSRGLEVTAKLQERKPSSEQGLFRSVVPSSLVSLGLLLSGAPAHAAKFVPPLETAVPEAGDAVPMTVEDLGGLAILGTILMLVFLVGNFVLPSLMFSSTNSATSFTRDEEGDFYHDPSFTKEFFRQARKSNEDVDELKWSKAPFSKIAHELSKILPPPSSVVGPPEMRRKGEKALSEEPIKIGTGVRLSGIVAVPGRPSGGNVEVEATNNQAASTSYIASKPSAAEGLDSSAAKREDATAVESTSNGQGSMAAVKEASFEQTMKVYKQDRRQAKRSRLRRSHKMQTGFGRARSESMRLHISD